MHERYPAVDAILVFSDAEKIEYWRHITDMYAMASMEEVGHEHLIHELPKFATPDPLAVRTREQETGHDVVAFLSVYTQDMPSEVKRHIHRGLTSSDLVDYAHFRALRNHAIALGCRVRALRTALGKKQLTNTVRVGRTHGQIASPTSLTHQLRVQEVILGKIYEDLDAFSSRPLIKSAGPTGNSPYMKQRQRRAAELMGSRIIPSTQIIPREYQLEWACIYLRLVVTLENLALLVRLGSRSEVAELREGAAGDRVGSSSMPHKQNPIDSEKVSGLARVARGYFSTLAENCAFWEDRDLSNSSVERITVPDYAAVVEYMTVTVTKVMRDLQFFSSSLLMTSAPWTATAQALLQQFAGLGPVEASQVVRSWNVPPGSNVNVLRQFAFNWLTDNVEDPEDRGAWMVAFNKEVATAT